MGELVKVLKKIASLLEDLCAHAARIEELLDKDKEGR